MMRAIITLLVLLCASEVWAQSGFEHDQLRYVRVRNAKAEKDGTLKHYFESIGLRYQPQNLFVRVFKHEKIMEIWMQSEHSDHYIKIKDYLICETSGHLGPKSKQGDMQIPEGFYYIDTFNPTSDYHLSLGINYPNPADQRRSSHPRLGGDIFIHGDCVTEGCIPLTDEKIKEFYWLIVKAKENGQDFIPIHIFPYRFKGMRPHLPGWQQNDPQLSTFWANLEEGYYYFENKKQPPFVHIEDGQYSFY